MPEKIPVSNKKLFSDKRKHTLRFWETATSEMEKTCLSVLKILYKNDDFKNYLLYQRQYNNFKNMRNILLQVVLRAIESNQLTYMEKVVLHAIRQLKSIISLNLHGSKSTHILRKSVSHDYAKAVSAITSCMSELYTKLEEIDKYLAQIPKSELQYQTETYRNLMLLDAFAKNLNYLLATTVKGREEKREHVADMVVLSVNQIWSYIKEIATSDIEPNIKQFNAKDKKLLVKSRLPGYLTDVQPKCNQIYAKNCINRIDKRQLGNHEITDRRLRCIWSKVHENKTESTENENTKKKFMLRYSNYELEQTIYRYQALLIDQIHAVHADETDTARSVEDILNESGLRNREKLNAIKKRIRCGRGCSPNNAKKLRSEEPHTSIPYGWIYPSEDQIEEYISKSGGCPTSTLQTRQFHTKIIIPARQRFTLEELIEMFPVDKQHLRFPPNPSNATIYKPEKHVHEEPTNITVKRVDEDLLQGLLWQWHEDSDSSSTVSFRFHFEMTDMDRRQKWFKGFRRLLQVDTVTMDSLQREIQLARQSKSADVQDEQRNQSCNYKFKVLNEPRIELSPPNYVCTSKLKQKHDKKVQFEIFYKFRSIHGIISTSYVFTNRRIEI